MVDLKNYDATKLRSFFLNHRRTAILMVGITVLVSVFAYQMQKSIEVVVNGVPTKVSTYKTTVKDVLESAGIVAHKKDKVVPTLSSKVINGMTIGIKRAIPVNIKIGGKGLVIYTAENSIGDMLKAEGITLNKSDIVSPKIQSPVYKDMKISITRVAENSVIIKTKVAYKVFSKADANLEKGKVKVLRTGIDGVKEEKYKVIYEDGKEVSRILVGEVIRKAPIDKLVAVGSLSWIIPSSGSRKIYFTKQYRVKATSYTADYACTGKRPGDRGFRVTATGRMVKRDKDNYSTVAVDKSVIPLGTKLYIEGYGFAIAADTGGGVKGRHVDLYFEPGTKEYRNWFTHTVKIYLLR